MKVKSITIKNYKSFSGMHKIILGDNNIITGNNGCGKSNLISSLFSVFMHGKYADETEVQYNKNEQETYIEVAIDNSNNLLRMDSANVIIRKQFTMAGATLSLNGKSISKNELRGLLEQVGFHKYNFMPQGFGYITDVMQLIQDISGATKLNEVSQVVRNNLSTEEVDDMIEKLEYKTLKYNDFVKKYNQFSKLDEERKDLEFKIAQHEIGVINEELKEVTVIDDKQTDENLTEVKLDEIRAEVIKKMKERSHFMGMPEANKVKTNEGEMKEIKERIGALNQQKEILEGQISQVLGNLEDKEVEIQAVKYFEAMGTERENLSDLEAKMNTLKSKEAISPHALLKKKKELYISQNSLSKDLNSLKTKKATLENRLLYLGNQQINIYDTIKDVPGVIGPIYDLIDVDSKYLRSFEAIAKKSLFYIVVEDEEVASQCIKLAKGKITLLNRQMIKSPVQNRIPQLTLLSDFVKAKDPAMGDLPHWICKNYFVSTDISKALSIRNKFDVSVVTLDGDITEAGGSITGGFDKNNDSLLELIETKGTIASIEKRLEEIKSEIREIEMYSEADLDMFKNSQGYLRYLQYKIELHKKGTIKLNSLEEEQILKSKLMRNHEMTRTKLNRVLAELNDITNKNRKQLESTNIKETLKNLNEEILNLKTKQTEIINSIYKENEVEDGSKTAKKNILLEKRGKLMKKMNIVSTENLKPNHSIIAETQGALRIVLNKLKEYSMYNFNIKSNEKMLDIKKVKNELISMKKDKVEIQKYLEYLEDTRDQQIVETFDRVSEYFTEIYRYITGQEISMKMTEESPENLNNKKPTTKKNANSQITMSLNGQEVLIDALSGGQKIVFSLSMILAIQRFEPSPIYVFDEIDANLDENSTARLYSLLKQVNSQFILSTFKDEKMVDLLNRKNIKVTSQSGSSRVIN